MAAPASTGGSANEPLLTSAVDEETPLPRVRSTLGVRAVRNWKRAVVVANPETGIATSDDDEFPQELNGLSKKFVTKVVTIIGGQSYLWEARQHRRNRPHPHDVDGKPELRSLAVFDKARIQAAMASPVKRLSFWVGPLFLLGALLFVLGTACETDLSFWSGKWSPDQRLKYVEGPFWVGALFFFLGCYASVIEAVNANFSIEWQEWEYYGRKGEPPRVSYSIFPSGMSSHLISFYGLAIQFFGSVLFLIGCSTGVVNLAVPGVPHEVVVWLLEFPYLLGGACFAVGGYLCAAEGSHSWWRGIVPPLRMSEVRSIHYWTEFLNWFGSFLFLAAGAAGWWLKDLDPIQSVWTAVGTWLLGSAIFVAQGALLYLEMVNPAW